MTTFKAQVGNTTVEVEHGATGHRVVKRIEGRLNETSVWLDEDAAVRLAMRWVAYAMEENSAQRTERLLAEENILGGDIKDENESEG